MTHPDKIPASEPSAEGMRGDQQLEYRLYADPLLTAAAQEDPELRSMLLEVLTAETKLYDNPSNIDVVSDYTAAEEKARTYVRDAGYMTSEKDTTDNRGES